MNNLTQSSANDWSYLLACNHIFAFTTFRDAQISLGLHIYTVLLCYIVVKNFDKGFYLHINSY